MAESIDVDVRTSNNAREDLSRRNISKSENAATPVTPPTRYISSTYSTPGSTFGQEQDAIIIELNPRYIKAGIEGESFPQCRYDFTPLAEKRLGDYRQHLPTYVRSRENLDSWGDGYELWKNQTKDLNFGLLTDRLERAVREVYNKYLLVDAGNARLVLVVPSLLPHPVLEAMLQTLFERWIYPSITLLPIPATALVAAGLRSGLVVDLDWEETVVTAMYEYREVKSYRTTRAMKMITKTLATFIQESLDSEDRFDLQMIEEILRRLGDDSCADDPDTADDSPSPGSDQYLIDWPTEKSTRPISLSRPDTKAVIMNTILGSSNETYPDDEELPVQRVIYNTLLGVPPDIRGICVSRIVFAGEGSEHRRLTSGILKSFKQLLERRGWTGTEGQKPRTRRPVLSELAQARAQPADVKHNDTTLSETTFAEERHLREKAKHVQPVVHGVVRQVDCLGPWAGASLITALKVKSFVEIQRERFLAHGLGGATRELDVSVVPQQGRTSLATRSKAGERTSWTLSGWA